MPQSEVAVLVSEDLGHFAQAMPLDGGTALIGNPNTLQHLAHTIRGIYKMLWESGIWTDFIEASEIDRLEDYKAIVFPFPLAASEELMKQLRTYVAKGGVLIAEACPGRYDTYGFGRPGAMSKIGEDLFGVAHKDLVLCREPDGVRWTPREWTHGEILPPTRFDGTGPFEGHSVMASLFVETYSTKGAEPIFLHGRDVTGVVNCHKKGKAYLVGTLLGHAGASFEDVPTQRFIVEALIRAGVAQEQFGNLLRRRRILADQEAWFLINPTGRRASARLDFEDYVTVEDLFEGKLKKTEPVVVEPYSVSVRIVGR